MKEQIINNRERIKIIEKDLDMLKRKAMRIEFVSWYVAATITLFGSGSVILAIASLV